MKLTENNTSEGISRTAGPCSAVTLRKGIGFRILVSIVVFSSAITLISTALQLYFDYRNDLRALQTQFDEIGKSYGGGLSMSLWNLDTNQLRVQMEGIKMLPNIQFVDMIEVTAKQDRHSIVSVGQRGGKAVLVREFPLIYKRMPDTPLTIGTLYVEASLLGIYHRLLDKAVYILIGQGVKTFLVSLFTLFIVHRLITRHLVDIAEFLRHYDLQGGSAMLVLARRSPRRADELDEVTTAFNAMSTRLREFHDELKRYKDHLEEEIQQRKHNETEVIATRNHLQATLDAVPDLLFELGLDGRYYRYHSPRTDLPATPAEALLGKTVSEILPPNAADTCLSALREANEKGRSTGKQFELRLTAGTTWFELSVSRKSTDSEQEARFIVLSRDITERKRHEMLEEARSHVFEKLAQGAALTDILDLVVRYAETFRPDLIGSIMLLSEDGKHQLTVSAPSLPQEYRSAVNGMDPCCTSSGLCETVLVEDIRTDPHCEGYKELAQRAGLISCWSKPILNSVGKVLGSFCIYQRQPGRPSADDLALIRQVGYLAALAIERKQAEDALRESEQRYREIFENVSELITLMEVTEDRRFRYLAFNSSTERFFGVSREQIIGRYVGSAVSEEMGELFAAKYRRCLASGTPIEEELELDLPGGHYILQGHLFPLFDKTGRIYRIISIARDITALREAERVGNESRAQLRELTAYREMAREDERKNIAREIHDELGQLLMALRLEISMAQLKHGYNRLGLLKHLQGLTALVDQTIHVVRNVSSSLRPAALDMGMQSALEWLRDEFKRLNGIDCQLYVDRESSELDEARSMAVFRIVQESLTNIARHACAGNVKISLQVAGNDYLLQVSDNGRGFDPEIPKKKSFGLIGMRERALMLGGEVDIDSAPGRGTTVKVRIPIARQKLSPDESASHKNL
jgi:PAS domain S-box-containing protein